MLVLIRFIIFQQARIGRSFVSWWHPTPNLPDREEVLILIDYHKNDIAKRKQLLRKLNQGAAYRYMVNNVFPKLRRSEITIVREIPEVAKETFEPVSSVSELFVSKQEEALPKDQPDKPVGESENEQACEAIYRRQKGR